MSDLLNQISDIRAKMWKDADTTSIGADLFYMIRNLTTDDGITDKNMLVAELDKARAMILDIQLRLTSSNGEKKDSMEKLVDHFWTGYLRDDWRDAALTVVAMPGLRQLYERCFEDDDEPLDMFLDDARTQFSITQDFAMFAASYFGDKLNKKILV